MKKQAIIVGLIGLGFILYSLNTFGEGAASDTYQAKCAKCHGKSGEGDGKSSKALNTPPTDFSKAETWAAKDAESRMFRAIKEGGQAIGQSKEMDSYPSLSDQEIKDMVEFLKTFRK